MSLREQMINELIEAARDVLKGGEHEGECVNEIGDPPGVYSGYDSCALHLQTAKERDERLRLALDALLGEQP